MGEININPPLTWHDLGNDCEECQVKMRIEQVMANARGDFIFRMVCPGCETEIAWAFTIQQIIGLCFDNDFLTVCRIKD